MRQLLNMFMQMALGSKDPRAAKAMELINNNDIPGQKQMAENLCRSIGMTTDQAIEQLRGKNIQGIPGAFMK